VPPGDFFAGHEVRRANAGEKSRVRMDCDSYADVGMGANTDFSVVNGVILNRLPFANPLAALKYE
jgi:hypothetical protein